MTLVKKFRKLWSHMKLKLMVKHIRLKVSEILMDTRSEDIISMLVKLYQSLKEVLQLEWRKESNMRLKLLDQLVKVLFLKALIVLIT